MRLFFFAYALLLFSARGGYRGTMREESGAYDCDLGDDSLAVLRALQFFESHFHLPIARFNASRSHARRSSASKSDEARARALARSRRRRIGER